MTIEIASVYYSHQPEPGKKPMYRIEYVRDKKHELVFRRAADVFEAIQIASADFGIPAKYR